MRNFKLKNSQLFGRCEGKEFDCMGEIGVGEVAVGEIIDWGS